MEKQTLLIIGLIGGILAVVGVFLPWVYARDVFGKEEGISGWNLTTRITSSYSPYLALAGGAIAIIGGLVLLKGKKSVSSLLPLGGTIAIVGGFLGYFDVSDSLLLRIQPELFLDWGYGFYVCIVGGILALIGGALALKAK